MERLILFRQRLDSLSDDEYQKFILSFRRDSVSSVLFHGLHHELNNDKMTNIRTLNEIITDIITKRRKSIQDELSFNAHDPINHNDHENQQNKPISKKVDDLPSVMISQIASYLTFHESLKFEKCNRSIFIGSRSSNLAIYSLNEHYLTKFITFYQTNSENHSHKAKRFKSVAINTKNINLLNALRFNLFKHVETLKIKFENYLNYQAFLLDLKEANAFPNIKTLTIDGAEWIDADTHNILQSVIKNNFKKIQFFDYTGYHSNFCFDDDWISKLKGITMRDYELDSGTEIYSTVSTQLNSIHIREGEKLLTTEINGKLTHLKEFCCCNARSFNEEEFEILLKQDLGHLKRVHVWSECVDPKFMELWQSFFNKIMKTVEYICLDVSLASYEKLLNALRLSLKHCRNDRLKIRINNIYLSENDCFDFGGFIELMINKMTAHCSNWMFIVQSLEIPKMISMNNINNFGFGKRYFTETKIADAFESLVEKYFFLFKNTSNDEKYDKYNFVISNNGCNINGYKERWIMKCENCAQTPIFG